MDEVDLTQERMEREAEALRHARPRPGLVPTGRCFNCDEIVPDHRLFCGPECRDDFDHRQRLEKRPG